MSTTDKATTPWVERYRPKNLQEVSHQEQVVATLQDAVVTGRLPHLLFYGPPGSGKTSVALALCRQLWHPSQYHRRVLELNASDERGISVVRDKVKHFASLAVGSSGPSAVIREKGQTSAASFFTKKKQAASKTDGADEMDVEEEKKQEEDMTEYPNPPFKIIILDEADAVTTDAQAALRRIIEAHSRITRFVLICNYVTRIIQPLASRCAKFRFQALPPASMKARLADIARAENCNVLEPQLDTILQVADGDMRRAVTTLQSVHALVQGRQRRLAQQQSDQMSDSNPGATGTVNDEDICEIAGVPPASVVEQLWTGMQSLKFDMMQKSVEDVILSGYSAQAVLSSLLERLLNSPDDGDNDELGEMGRAKMAIRIAEAEKFMTDGADEYLQLMTVCGLGLTCLLEQKKRLQDN